jgi:hypothetical protein
MTESLTELAVLLLGILIGFEITAVQDWLARLRQFRARMNVFGVRLSETDDDGLEGFYESSRLEVLEACATIKQDISFWHRKTFERAFAAYCAAQKDDHARNVNQFIHRLCPSAWPLQPDQRGLRERLTGALNDLVDCSG